ncbi:MAG: aminotransferase class I/II-fold pyridoxal phosphate-dependent enzyme [Pseudomonadota bacterium]|nr:aminotransferase class I/II-fold pyridoxal phosphate-dependent enzyme [Pseudomonadota bacterium]
MQQLDRFSDLPEYAFPRLRALLDGVKGAGVELPMHIGEPKHPFPDFITNKIIEHANTFNSYPSNDGISDLLVAISEWLKKRYGVKSINPESQIISLNGTREGLFNAAIALSEDANTSKVPAVLIPNPFYQCYMVAAKAIGAEPIFTPADATNGFLPDFHKLPKEILNRTILCYVCSPSNPQGAIAEENYWTHLMKLAETYNFFILADECYSEIYRDKKPPGAIQFLEKHLINPKRLLVFNSLSKRSNLPGLRSGFAVGDRKIINRLKKLKSYSGAPSPTALQFAAAEAWRDEEHVKHNRRLYKQKLDTADEVLGGICGYKSPDAGFFVWLPVNDDERTAKVLWEKYGIKVLPGSYLSQENHHTFYQENPGRNYIRIALVDSESKIKKGLESIAAYLMTSKTV